MRRRDALKTLVVLTVAAGCGSQDVVRVAVVWSGWELTTFRRIAHAIPDGDRQVTVLSAGDDIAAVLAEQVAAIAAPDVALVPRPALVERNHDRLVPLGPMRSVPQGWERLLTFDGQVYGTWFKAAYKSLVWYRADRLGSTPTTWDDWVHLCRARARAGRPTLAIGAANGWVLSDWFDNVMLGIDPETFDGLADGTASWRHPSVAATLSRLAEVWSIPGVFPGGPERALVTQFDESLLDVFRHGRAPMVAAADFAYPIITRYGSTPAHLVRWFHFPYRTGEHEPRLVGGDAAVLLKPGGAGGRALIEWLVAPEAQEIWARQGGFLSLNERVDDYPGKLAPLADEVRRGGDTGVTFGLSDRLGGRLAGADGRGSWQILTDFFAAVAGHPERVERAIEDAVDAFVAAGDRR